MEKITKQVIYAADLSYNSHAPYYFDCDHNFYLHYNSSDEWWLCKIGYYIEKLDDVSKYYDFEILDGIKDFDTTVMQKDTIYVVRNGESVNLFYNEKDAVNLWNSIMKNVKKMGGKTRVTYRTINEDYRLFIYDYETSYGSIEHRSASCYAVQVK